MNNPKKRKKNSIQWSDQLIKEYKIESQHKESRVNHNSLEESKDIWPHIEEDENVHIINSKCKLFLN